MFMCGNYGEPAEANDTIKIFKWFREINPNITLGMDSNGSARDKVWWTELASILCNPKDYVIFGIDGLKDTNHIYRRGANWESIIENVNAYVSNGGIAHWDMLVYQHNEHQINAAIELAKELGFKWFRSKVTKKKMDISFLQYPRNHTVIPVASSINIDCHALNEKSIYVDAHGRLLPCCFIGSVTVDHEFELKYNVKLDSLSIKNQKLVDVISKFNHIPLQWSKNPAEMCKVTCNKDIKGTTHTNQWKSEINF